MKTLSKRLLRSHGLERRNAFTITELMIAIGLFSLVVIGSILSHLVGLRMCAINQTKLKTTHSDRKSVV